MRVFKWKIDKEKGHFSYTVQKASKIKEINYTTLTGESVSLKPSTVRKGPHFETKFGRVVTPLNLD